MVLKSHLVPESKDHNQLYNLVKFHTKKLEEADITL